MSDRAKPRAHGEGTVVLWKHSKTPGTKYRAHISVTLPDGTTKDAYGYGPTKKAAVAKRQLRVQRLQRANPSAETITVHQLAHKFLRQKQTDQAKPSTINQYADVLRLHVLPALGHMFISQVDTVHVQACIDNLVEAGKFRTADLVRVVMAGMYGHAKTLYRRQIITGSIILIDPTEPIKVVPNNTPDDGRGKVWSEEQLRRFLEVGWAHYEAGELHFALLYTAVNTGLRRGELLGLTWDNVIQENGTSKLQVHEQLVNLRGHLQWGTLKRSSSVRAVPISTDLHNFLLEHQKRIDALRAAAGPSWKGTHDLVFPAATGRPTDPSNLRRALEKLMDRATSHKVFYKHSTSKNEVWMTLATDGEKGRRFLIPRIEGAPEPAPGTRGFLTWGTDGWTVTPHPLVVHPVRLHTLRKTFATFITRQLMVAEQFPPKIVQKLLGHSNANVAMQFYTQALDSDVDAAVLDLGFQPNKGMNRGMSAKR